MALRLDASSLRILAISVYVASLLFPPYITRHPAMQESGFTILVFGWFSLLGLSMAWLANPLVIFCFFRMKTSPRLCRALSVLAIVVAFDFARVKTLGWDSSRDEHAGAVVGFGVGSYLWLAALALALMASLAFVRESGQGEDGIEEESDEEPDEEAGRRGLLRVVWRRQPVVVVISCALLLATLRWAFLAATGSYADARLTERVTSAMSAVPLPPGTTEIYRAIRANHDCKWARMTAIYSVDLGREKICESLHSSLGAKWNRDACSDLLGSPPGRGPKFSYQRMFASVEAEHLQLEHRAYGVDATPRSLNITPYTETDVIRAAHRLGKSFFFVDIRYQEPRGRDGYACNEINPTCYCTSHTFMQTTRKELQRMLTER
jgi:hypothetical protein